MRISLPAVLAFLCGFAATVVVVQHRVPALGALHLDGTHSPHHLRAKPADFAPAAAAPRSGLLDKLRAELPAAMRATPPPTGAAPSAQERREAERLEAERRAEAEVAAAREEVAREALARPKPGSIGEAVAAAPPAAGARPKPQLVWHEVKKKPAAPAAQTPVAHVEPTAKAPVGKHQKPKLMCDNVPTESEVVYWSNTLETPSTLPPPRDDKYLTFEYDAGGWNNIRMGLECLVVLAMC